MRWAAQQLGVAEPKIAFLDRVKFQEYLPPEDVVRLVMIAMSANNMPLNETNLKLATNLVALVEPESRGMRMANNGKDKGLFQINEYYAGRFIGDEERFDPLPSAILAVKIASGSVDGAGTPGLSEWTAYNNLLHQAYLPAASAAVAATNQKLQYTRKFREGLGLAP